MIESVVSEGFCLPALHHPFSQNRKPQRFMVERQLHLYPKAWQMITEGFVSFLRNLSEMGIIYKQRVINSITPFILRRFFILPAQENKSLALI